MRIDLVSLTAAAFLIAAMPCAGAADAWKDCQGQNATEAVRACTGIIDGKSETGVRLAQAYNLRAVAWQRVGRMDESIADFGSAIRVMEAAGKSDWELAFAYFMRANAYRAWGDLDKAIADHSTAIRVAPSWDKSYNERGAIYFQKGDLPHALEDISKVISLRPDSPRVADSYAIRALLQLRMGAAAKGLPDADRAIQLNARSAMALYVRSRIYEALGRSEDAASELRAALAIDPNIEAQMRAMAQAGKP